MQEKNMEINSTDSLKSVLVNNINNGERLSFLFGAGISINTNDKTKKPNGIGLANDFIKIFEDTIKFRMTPGGIRISLPETKLRKLNKDLKTTKNKYSTYAKFFENCGYDIGKFFFKPIICEIEGFDEIKHIKEEKRIIEFLDNNSKIEKIILNKALTYLGKLLPLINDDIKIYTSNIDPFIEIVAQRSGKKARSIHYHYEKKNSKKINSHPFVIEHFHGYWLDRSLHENLFRSKNKSSFQVELESIDNLFVIGYDGWDDSMFKAIKDYLLNSENHKCIVHWAYFNNNEDDLRESDIYKMFNEDSQKYLKLYKGIDANYLFELVYTETLKKNLETYLDNSIKKIDTKSHISFDSVPFIYSSTFTSRLNGRVKNENVVTYSYNKFLMNKKVGISSKFGLGKSTLLEEISNHIISARGKLPIHISLKDKELNKLNNDDIYYLILNKIEEIIRPTLGENSLIFDNMLNRNRLEVTDILKNKFLIGELVLLLDGIDESNYRNDNFEKIIDNLIEIQHPFIFSFRTEFHKLLDCLIDNSIALSKADFVSIELKEWDEKNSNLYLNSLFEDVDLVNRLKVNCPYLMKRPIFLNLIKVVCSKNHIILNDNISDLFYQSLISNIYLNLEEFIQEEKLIVSKEILFNEIYNLIIEIAISLYLEYRHFIEKTSTTFKPKISFSKETLRLIISKYTYLNPDVFIRFIDFSERNKEYSLFKKENNEYTFFHRSLFDYLVANGAAKSIMKNGICSNAWNVYQTDEISEYFVNEVKNILNASTKEENELFNRNIIKAFDKELATINSFTEENIKQLEKQKKQQINKLKATNEKDLIKIHKKFQILDYSEKLEEVIFYCGKYYPDNSISEKLELINNNKYYFPPKYYRTTSITLSRLYNKYGHPENTIYTKNFPIYRYLDRIFYDLTTPTRMFYKLQSEIDIDYYGKEELYKKSLESVNKLIDLCTSVDDFNPLDLLKTFSFFLTLDIQSKKDYIKKKNLIEKLKNKKFSGDLTLFKGFLESLEFMFFRKSYLFRNKEILEDNDLLYNIIKEGVLKRIATLTEKNNIVRLFNGSGDGIDSLYIDYYNKHIVIQLDTRLLDDKIDLIKNALLDSLNTKLIDSINTKYTWWENKRESIPPENIYGKSKNTIICNENELKFYVDITSSKTGFFIDNRNIRNYISEISEGKKILNLCSFTGTLGCLAKMNNCDKIINVEKVEKNNILAKENYKLNNITYNENEFITGLYQNIESKLIDEKFDVIILDLAEISVLPKFYKKTHETYIRANESILKFLENDGILITTCCSHGFSRKRFNFMIDELVNRNNLEEIVIDLESLYDHPLTIHNDYLKIKVLKKH
ncbi:class I SAM-dependent methyltransferase [Polaribacter uvawellassae]|uniref:class I SAM-dependent methyltransferase n=1 Tax=Polaribacter uvawellassae TaxID=3133495 RepID=UPI003218FCF6